LAGKFQPMLVCRCWRAVGTTEFRWNGLLRMKR
jgi:hypothetical protein